MSRRGVWFVTLPLVLAGIEAAHAAANALFGAPGDEVFATAASGRELAPFVAAVLFAVLMSALAARAAGCWWSPRQASVIGIQFAVLPPVGFVLLELGEAIVGDEPFGWRSLRSGVFVAGFALQLPVALLGFLVARWLLRLSDELGEIAWGEPPVGLPWGVDSGRAAPRDDACRSAAVPAADRSRAPPLAAAA